MKSLQEIYNEILADEALRSEVAGMSADDILEWLKSRGCEVSEMELRQFIRDNISSLDTHLSDSELESVAGGWSAPGTSQKWQNI